MNDLQLVRYTREETEALLELMPMQDPKQRLRSSLHGFMGVLDAMTLGLALGLFLFIGFGLAGVQLSDAVLIYLFIGLPGAFFAGALVLYFYGLAVRPDRQTAKFEYDYQWKRLRDTTPIPPAHWDPEILGRFETFLVEGRATTIAECAALYQAEPQ
ncbi:MAG TPA: hypothetical protein VNT01_02525 [Symbiobacteriaceae bacterium]|nr:hypothetical protein [Symbiobacteriaceae bacterium]